MNLAELGSALDSFAERRVMVVGDLMLDEHVWGAVARISPEAPVMVVHVDSAESDYRAGGAANVANNIRAFGAGASVVGVVGDDEGRGLLLRSLEDKGVDTSGALVEPGRLTTRKTRVWASHRHQVVRIDRESGPRVSQAAVDRMVEHIRREVSGVDAILISDYSKGVVTRDIACAAIEAARTLGKVCVTNAKPRNISHYSGIDVITLNQSEASAAAGMDIEDTADVEKAGREIMALTGCRGLVITRGAMGLCVFSGPGSAWHLPAIEMEVYDVAGAGDTVVSALTLALSCGLDLNSAGLIANCAGAAVVRKVGVATTSVDEIFELLAQAKTGG